MKPRTFISYCSVCTSLTHLDRMMRCGVHSTHSVLDLFFVDQLDLNVFQLQVGDGRQARAMYVDESTQSMPPLSPLLLGASSKSGVSASRTSGCSVFNHVKLVRRREGLAIQGDAVLNAVRIRQLHAAQIRRRRREERSALPALLGCTNALCLMRSVPFTNNIAGSNEVA